MGFGSELPTSKKTGCTEFESFGHDEGIAHYSTKRLEINILDMIHMGPGKWKVVSVPHLNHGSVENDPLFVRGFGFA